MEINKIQNLISNIRDQRVMFDRDLSALYGVETRVLNQAVKRNIDRFPEDFMFQLSETEFNDWRSQNVMSNSIKMGLRRKPYVFTELGVAMLSSVLNSQMAVKMNISIMRAFVELRKSINSISISKISELEYDINNIKLYIEEVFTDYNDINEDTRVQLELINQTIAELQHEKNVNETKTRPKIGF